MTSRQIRDDGVLLAMVQCGVGMTTSAVHIACFLAKNDSTRTYALTENSNMHA